MNVEFRVPLAPNFLTIVKPVAMNGGGAVIPIQNIAAETLARVADAWRADLFRKAGQDDPAPKIAALLFRYMQHVQSVEGSTFVDTLRRSDVKFTDEELAVLRAIDAQLER